MLLQVSSVRRVANPPRAFFRSFTVAEVEQSSTGCRAGAAAEPKVSTELVIQPGLSARMDSRLALVLLENLLGNAFKFTGKRAARRIEFGTIVREDVAAFFVRDDGAGFDMAFSEKLFTPFQRLHTVREFPGTGIGLATVYRIVRRHGGEIRAEGAVGHGATFSFTVNVGVEPA